MNKKREPKYTLAEARKIIASEAGNASFDARGITGMRKMAKQSWEQPSAAREAFNIIQKALTPFKSERVAELRKVGWAKCERCEKQVTPVKRANLVPRNWNAPYGVTVFCAKCLKKHEAIPMSTATVTSISEAKKLSDDPKIIIAKALGDARW